MSDNSENADDTAGGGSGEGTDSEPSVKELKDKVAILEAEQQKLHKDFGSQRAHFKELYHQKEEELERVKAQNKKLSAELDIVKNELSAFDVERKSYLEEKQMCDNDMASLQKIVDDTVFENKSLRTALDDHRVLQSRWETENAELRQHLEERERPSDPLSMQKFTQVTKSIARKMMGELGADSASSPAKESLDEDMRKAHEDAEVLRSLMVPLEEEIRSLKEKLRDADHRLRHYEQQSASLKSPFQESEMIIVDSEPIVPAPTMKPMIQEPLIQLSPTSPMELSVTGNVPDAKASPQENKDLEAFLGSGSVSISTATEEVVPTCDKCSQYEIDVGKLRQQLSETQKTLENSEKAGQRARDDLNRERTSRHEMESNWNGIKDQYDEKVTSLNQAINKCEQALGKIEQKYQQTVKVTDDRLAAVACQNKEVIDEISRIHAKNEKLMGRHFSRAHELQDQLIDLPDTVPELHEMLLRRQEELIASKVAAETFEDEASTLRAELQNLLRQDALMRKRENDYRTQFSQIQKQVNHYCARLQEKDENEKKLTSEYQEVKRQLDEALSAKGEMQETIQKYKSKISSLQGDLTNSEQVQKDFVLLTQSLQKDLEKLRLEDTEVRWQHDEDVDMCPTCKNSFTHQRKKEHCRHCGRIFCNGCLPFTVTSGPLKRPSRVCKVCHTLLNPGSAPYFSTQAPSAPD